VRQDFIAIMLQIVLVLHAMTMTLILMVQTVPHFTITILGGTVIVGVEIILQVMDMQMPLIGMAQGEIIINMEQCI
jgi:hypothetical protein